jgi:hypothetical protein
MPKAEKTGGWTLAAVALVILAGASLWIGYRKSVPAVARDYEECADEALVTASSKPDYSRLIIGCGERFAGRRKTGGGYSYFDFMQNRSFDLAGPNPTAEERKQIDSAYAEFLGAQQRELLSLDLAKQPADREQVALDPISKDAGPPLILTPKVPLPVKRPVVERPKVCEDGSLSCGWAKLSEVVRRAFASDAAKTR